jgi:hypothetical protein
MDTPQVLMHAFQHHQKNISESGVCGIMWTSVMNGLRYIPEERKKIKNIGVPAIFIF